MPREKEDFRETLARLQERFPGREAITTKELAQMLECDPRTVANSSAPRLKVGRVYRHNIVAVARWMA